MRTIKLTADNFAKQVSEFGFFAEAVPPCFTSKGIADNIQTILPAIKATAAEAEKSRKNTTAPIELSTYKNDISRRVLSIPNPEAFLRLVMLISENWAEIQTYAESENSLSPITYMRSYKDSDLLEEINNEGIREANKVKSDFVEGQKNCIRAGIGFQYRLKVDIANCYPSMYTHSVTWAICGKKEAKRLLQMTNAQRKLEPASIQNAYSLGNRLDAFMRFQKNNETNGIVVGPFTSRIFSEIILSAIDKILRERFVFRRYVDDYKFFFRSESDASESVKILERILSEYNLNLNLAKTEIKQFPYEQISSIKQSFDAAIEKDGIFGVLNAAALFHTSGEKGAYKYALKYIRNHHLKTDDFPLVFPLLINIMLLDPKYGKYVIQFMKRNKQIIDTDELQKIINRELKNSLNLQLQQESLLFIYMIHDLKLKVEACNILSIIQSENDLAIIIALDMWTHHNKRVLRTRTEAREINLAVKELANSLAFEKYTGNRWLLLYEAEAHSLFPQKVYTPIVMTPFFALLKQNGVDLYK